MLCADATFLVTQMITDRLEVYGIRFEIIFGIVLHVASEKIKTEQHFFIGSE